MKKLFFPLLLVIVSFSVDAQKSIPSNQDKLNIGFVNPANVKRAGAIITATGFTLFVTGVVMFVNSPTECDMINPTTYGRCHITEVKGGAFLLTGLGIMAVGIPVWSIGKAKERGYKIRLFPAGPLGSINSVGLEIRF